MHLFYIHQFFAGPDAPGPAQPRALVRLLAERGHRVEVLACDFNAYNEQDEPEESFQTEAGGSVQVHRLKTPRQLRKSLSTRLRSYGTFAWDAYRFGRSRSAPDVVMSSIQPLFGGFAALRLARRWKRPFLLEIRDLWPDALVVKKAIRAWQAAPLQAMARSLYFGADRVVCLTPGLQKEILQKGVPPAKVDVFPNGFNPVSFQLEDGTREKVRERQNWSDSFVAVYTGTHTEVTSIETIVHAAEVLRDRKDIRIDLFGTGQTKSKAIALANELKLENIHFHDPVPKSEIPSILAGADAGLITLFKSPLIHIYFENKFIDYMGSRLPILGAMGGVQADLITGCGAGQVVPSLDHKGLAAAIADAADHPERSREMGEAGYRFISTKLVQKEILTHYAECLEALAAGGTNHIPAWTPFQ